MKATAPGSAMFNQEVVPHHYNSTVSQFKDSGHSALREKMRDCGLEPPDSFKAGSTTRFSTNGKSSDRGGWVFLFNDERGASFGDWRTGAQGSWQAEHDRPLNKAEQTAFNNQVKLSRAAAIKERDDGYKAAAIRAADEWYSASTAPAEHAYLIKKGIRAGIARVGVDGRLLIPVYGSDGSIQSLQKIASDGQKRFFIGCKTSGGHCWLGVPKDGDVLLLSEGWATASSLFESTGFAVCTAFSAGNLRSVAELIRKQYPEARLLVAGDDDVLTAGNPGRSKATEAALAVDCKVGFPSSHGDFNDLANAVGLGAVKAEIALALGDHKVLVADFEPPLPPVMADFDVPQLRGLDARDGTTDTRPLSELGNAWRLADAHAGNLHYVHSVGAWLHWNDGAWHWDADGAIVRGLAAQLPAQIYAEGARHLQDALHFAKWSRFSQKQATIDSSVSLLKDFEAVRLPLSSVDSDSFMVGIDNARSVLDLKLGITRPARQSDYITKSLNVDSLGDSAKAVRWLAFLDEIFNADSGLIDWIQRWFGYCLSGSTSEQFFVFCYGVGCNGKSVFGDLLRHLVGDYARAIASETLTEAKRAAGAASNDLYDLIGCRLALSSETEDNVALAESLVKGLVSGDTMSVRKNYSMPVQFTPQFKLMMLGNHKPVVKGNDFGVWRRIRLVPFLRTFKESERDPHLSEKLKSEVRHILAWAVDGCLDWQKRGLSDVPAVVRDATLEYQAEQDYIGRWINECCDLSPRHETSSTDIYANYKNWATDNGLRPVSNINLGRRLSERGLFCRQSNGNRLWSGIGIKQPIW